MIIWKPTEKRFMRKSRVL